MELKRWCQYHWYDGTRYVRFGAGLQWSWGCFFLSREGPPITNVFARRKRSVVWQWNRWCLRIAWESKKQRVARRKLAKQRAEQVLRDRRRAGEIV